MGFDFSIVKWIKISYSPPIEVVKLDDWFGWHVQNPYQTNMMIDGWDKDVGPSLYYLDYIATLHKLEKGGLGYGESDGHMEITRWKYYGVNHPYLMVNGWKNLPKFTSHNLWKNSHKLTKHNMKKQFKLTNHNGWKNPLNWLVL